MTAESILAIPIEDPELLFSRDDIHGQYKKLARVWHPDLNPDPKAASVFDHIVKLEVAAAKRLAAGRWRNPGELKIIDLIGKEHLIQFKRKLPFELGTMYYGPDLVAFEVGEEFADLRMNGRAYMDRFKYRDDAMKTEISKYLPNVERGLKTQDGAYILVLKKTPDVFLLHDVLEANGGKLRPEHVAWILNTAYNIACYLEWAGLTHNAIGLDTYFLSPEHHSGLLLGGWWYGAEVKTPFKAVPAWVGGIAPPDVLRKKNADPRLDLALIRVMGLDLLGDRTGMALSAAPKPMVDFLRRPSSGSAKKDYKAWSDDVLPACFGKRRFVNLQLNPEDIWNLPRK